MDTGKAEEILRLLANGIDPVTGEVLPDDSPCSHPSVIRALFTVLESARNHSVPVKLSTREKQAQNIANGKPRNAGLPWTDELRREVASKFQSHMSVPDLAEYFERTEGAISSELTRQGLIDRD